MQESTERGHRQNLESELRLTGRILWLTENPDLVRRQLDGEDFASVDPTLLAKNVSTDEIIPSRHCLYYKPDILGQYALTGYHGNVIQPGDIKRGGFDLIIAGSSFGSGSSREHAPIALQGAGIKFVASTPFERIFKQNSQNIGLATIENPNTLNVLRTNGEIKRAELTQGLDAVTKDILNHGGLLPYTKARLEGKVQLPRIETAKRPMTMVEKIAASHWVNPDGSTGVVAIKPGDSGFIKADFHYGYEIMTPLSYQALKDNFGDDFKIPDPQNTVLFVDHTVLLQTQTPEQQNLVLDLYRVQSQLARRAGFKIYNPEVGICHNVVVDKHALPSQVILGTDSHTCSVGVLGALADGIGSTEMAASWLTGDVRLTVPQTWRFNFSGELANGVMAKDVMLFILSQGKVKSPESVGKVFEYGGAGLENWSFDELFVLPNMSVECSAATGIVEPTSKVVDYLVNTGRVSKDEAESLLVKSDEDASFEEIFEIDLSKIPKMVATPGNPGNGRPVSELEGTKTDAVYIGSCTGGKLEDLIAAARVLKGQKVAVPTYIQASSQEVKNQAQKLGLFSIFENAGVNVIAAGCGDCCNLGFGVALEGQTIVSDTNRNFPGRMGRNRNVFLVNPAVAAQTAISGTLTA